MTVTLQQLAFELQAPIATMQEMSVVSVRDCLLEVLTLDEQGPAKPFLNTSGEVIGVANPRAETGSAVSARVEERY